MSKEQFNTCAFQSRSLTGKPDCCCLKRPYCLMEAKPCGFSKRRQNSELGVRNTVRAKSISAKRPNKKRLRKISRRCMAMNEPDGKKYFMDKKKAGLIFTWHSLDPAKPYLSMDPRFTSPRPIFPTKGVSWWSRKFCRYRNAAEQRAFIANGMKDLEPIPEEVISEVPVSDLDEI